jgi:hypothetical protein
MDILTFPVEPISIFRGTADITVHEKIGDGKVKELCRANGSNCGGTSIDNAFIELMENVVVSL